MRSSWFALRVALRSVLVLAIIAAGVMGLPGQPAAAAGAANDHTVLILGPTVSGGASSIEAQAAIAAGMTVEVVDNAGWAAKSAADFATYRALILGDPTCTGIGSASAAIANASTWGPVVNGRVIIIGSDPVFHRFQGGGALTTGGVTFVVGEAGKTSAYITLSCYYHGTAAHTPVPLLGGIGTFTVTGVGCFNNAHIVATHPSLTGITDATLSNWSCSVHEAFDSWPIADFQVLAIARNFSSAYTAPDGTVGTPYILARGVSVISDITLAPASGSSAVGSNYTLTATVVRSGLPAAGLTVTFTAIVGPNAGMTRTGTTNASGQATATYTSAAVGTDTWVARFTADEITQTSNTAKVAWTAGTAPTSTVQGATLVASSPSCGKATLKATGVTPGLPHQIVIASAAGGVPNVVNVTAEASQIVSVTIDVKTAFGIGGGIFSAFVRMTSNGVTVSNTETFNVAACPTPTPQPATPAPTPTPTPTQAIVRLPSTATGGEAGLATLAFGLMALAALGAIVWRKRTSRS